MSVLIVVAHPDDEVLGCGGTIANLTLQGKDVYTCVLSGAVQARHMRPGLTELTSDILDAQKIMGAQRPIIGDLPNIEFNTIPHIHLVQFIENAIVRTGATTIFTHHPADLNNDHYHTSIACQAASRLFQRRAGVAKLENLYYMEVPSATDWTLSADGAFRPTAYFEVGEYGLAKKLQALSAYRGVSREFPHPRCAEIMRGLAALRGGQAGMHYAEAFQVAFTSLHRFALEDDTNV